MTHELKLSSTASFGGRDLALEWTLLKQHFQEDGLDSYVTVLKT